MRYLANFEVRSEVSVISDDLFLDMNKPNGAYKVRIKNITRPDYSTPFLLSVDIYYDAKDINEAVETGNILLAEYLNMIAFITGAAFYKHRTRLVMDADPAKGMGMREMRVWSESLGEEEPNPILQSLHTQLIEHLLRSELPPAIQKALRWFRLGVGASAPDDQFVYFWLALEILAEHNKPTSKVNDKCPVCRTALYCESCGTTPEHRPYPKQAIRALITSIDPIFDEKIADILDNTRNSLMHGSTLREAEATLPEGHEELVDILGRILWQALYKQFSFNDGKGTYAMDGPTAFVRYKASVTANVETVLPMDSQGHFNIDDLGLRIELKHSRPPQSAAPFLVRMTVDQFSRLQKARSNDSGRQAMLDRARKNYQVLDDHVVVQIISTDMKAIKGALESNEPGEWQDLFREILRSAGSDRSCMSS